MTQDEYIKELKRLYELAVKQSDVSMALGILDRLRQVGVYCVECRINTRIAAYKLHKAERLICEIDKALEPPDKQEADANS